MVELRRGARAGRLPAVARLLARSMTGPVETDPGLFTVSTWFSLATATRPSAHGRFSWRVYDPYDYRSSAPAPRATEPPTLWRILDQAGYRVAVIDYPRGPLESLAHGLQLVDWSPHDRVHGGPASVPEAFAGQAVAHYGADPCDGNCDRVTLEDADDYRAFGEDLCRRALAKARLFNERIAGEGFDLACLAFGEAHCAGHRCWHLHDPAHPRHRVALAGRAGDPVDAVYRALDQAIGEVVEAAGDVDILLLAHLGMTRNQHAQQATLRALAALNEVLPHGLPAHAPAHLAAALPAAGRRRAAAKCFALELGNSGLGLRVNLLGRERFGRIRPGGELIAYLRELRQELLALRHLDDDAPVFEGAMLTRDSHGDDHVLPDLVLGWNRRRTFRGVRSPLVGAFPGDYSPRRSGDHRALGGYAFADGGGAGRGPRVHACDIGATLAARYGLRMPDADGRVIDAWLRRPPMTR